MFSNFKNFLSKNFTLIWFSFSLLFLVFISGILVGKFKVFPYTIYEYAKKGVRDWNKNWKQNLKVLPTQHIGLARQHNSFELINKTNAWKGVTLVTTFIRDVDTSGPGLILVDMEGNILHKWAISLNSIFPGTKRGDWDVLITGASLLSNGDVVFNFNDVGTVKLDVCSNVLWSARHGSHHNIFIDNNNNIWTGGRKFLEEHVLTMEYPNELLITDPETIIQLSPNGDLLKEIDVFEIILKSDLKGSLFANGQQKLFHKIKTDGDNFMHLNDVEILSKELADEYSLFDAGDIMLSFRNVNLIVVLDSSTKKVKWSFSGPFLRQHDPDFIGSGKISIFDNLGGGPANDVGFASRIISVDTDTMAYDTTYQASPSEHFYTHERGSHQTLPNGNILITETFAGRIFETTKVGEIVWQYTTIWDDNKVIHPYQAERYDDATGTLSALKCQE